MNAERIEFRRNGKLEPPIFGEGTYTKDLLNKVNSIISTDFHKQYDLFKSSKLKFVVEFESDYRFAARYTEEEETIYLAMWVYYLNHSNIEITIFNPKTLTLLEEITHFVDNKLNFSNQNNFIEVMENERMENTRAEIDMMFQFVYLMAFSFNKEYGIGTRNWKNMLITCNRTYLFSLHPLKRIPSILWHRKKLKKNISIKSSLPILAKEYLFDLVLARKAFTKYYKNQKCLEKLFDLDDKYKFNTQPTKTIKSIIGKLELNNFQSSDDLLKYIIPESYNLLIEFEDKVK